MRVTDEDSTSIAADMEPSLLPDAFPLPASSDGNDVPASTCPLLNNPFHEDISTGTRVKSENDSASNHAVLGQFSFAPATQTTVVTTTTTTTTKFPPLLFKAPRGLLEPNTRLYPLAASPTPQAIKELNFRLAGKSAVFKEADDATESMSNLLQQQHTLRSSKGTIRSVLKYRSDADTPTNQAPRSRRYKRGNEGVPLRTSARIRKSASSGQLADSKNSIPPAEIRSTANRGTPVARDSSSLNRASRLHFMQISTPVTPSVSIPKPDEGFSDDTMDGRRDTSTRPAHFIITPETDSKEFSRTISPKVEGAEGRRAQAPACSQDSFSSVEGHVTPTSAGTQDSRVQDRSRSHTRPRPAALDTAAGQDGSLPSPSLSPVTAAASLQSRRSYFEEQGPTAPSSATGLTFSPKSEPDSWTLPSEEADHEYRNIDTSMQVNGDEVGQSTMMDLPDMLDSFDAMPLEMKTYVMFQLLRRCPKPVLHFVADQVNPALKCDFLTLLPPELAQNVISYLDLRSLCRASQVSKKWRQIIDTDERAWKTLFDASGFEATTEEMQRAVQEGWGWQSGVSHDDPERDLSGFDSRTSSERLQSPAPLVGMAPHPAAASEMRSTVTPAKRGSKRKIGSKAKASNRKLQKKHETGVEEVAFFDEESLKRHLASNEGPYAAAQAALIAVPSPPVGLPSIRNLHLYKSLYRRHHLIRSYWTNDHVPPRHTAFKAHHRHVVTCLQFDSDKILTGSDDTNINVYDTRTGALLQRLDGHEGGVWALQYRGNTLVSGSTDRSVRVWDIAHGKCTHVFQGHTSTVRCLIILIPTVIGRDAAGRDIVMPKEPIVITGSRDSTLRIWKLPPDAEPPESRWDPKIDPVAPQPAGTPQTASTDTNTSTTSARNTDTDSVTSPTNPLAASILPTTTTNPWLSGFNPPGALATGAGANAQSMHLASMAALAAEHAARGESPYFVRALNGHTQSVRAIAAHGDTLVSGSYDHTVRVWRISTGDLLHRLAGHAQKVYSVVLDHRRQRCISGSMDNLVKVWSLETGAQLFSLEGHTSLVGLLDLQRDRLVSAAADSTLRVWDPATGRCQSVLSAHTGAITCFQHDGRKVVSGSDRCLKMWDVQTGQFQRDLLRDLSGVWQVRFDERRCVAAVQRNNLTFIEVLDFGAARDGVPHKDRGRRIVVDPRGNEMVEGVDAAMAALDGAAVQV